MSKERQSTKMNSSFVNALTSRSRSPTCTQTRSRSNPKSRSKYHYQIMSINIIKCISTCFNEFNGMKKLHLIEYWETIVCNYGSHFIDEPQKYLSYDISILIKVSKFSTRTMRPHNWPYCVGVTCSWRCVSRCRCTRRDPASCLRLLLCWTTWCSQCWGILQSHYHPTGMK